MIKNPTGGLSRLFFPCLLTTLLSAMPGLTFANDDNAKAFAAELSKPYVTVNGIAQATAWAELIFRDQRQRGAPDSAQLRQSVRDVLITQAVIEDAARKAGMDANPLIQAQMDLARREVLVRAWQQDFVSRFSASDAAIRAEYTRQIERIGDKEFLLRHLLLSDESAAKLLIEKVKGGSKLETLSAEYSKDQATKNRGGLADWAHAGQLLPPLADAVRKLQKGKHAPTPVRTDLGWHVVQLDDVRPFKAPELEQLKPQIIRILAERALESQIKELRDKAKIK